MESMTTNKTASNATVKLYRYTLTPSQQAIITSCYVVGIFGNSVALILLCKKGLRSNNQKHNLILKCLSANDLTALLGMLILMYIQLYTPRFVDSLWICRARVICRIFGFQSGAVAIVMAVERWLALTKPFFYQQHVTVMRLRLCIFALWSFSFVLVCMPFLGFGLYYDTASKKCANYRDATLPLDVIYAYIYFVLGMSLCIGIVFCNIAVMRSLCCKGYTYNGGSAIRIRKPVLMRRVSRNISMISTASTREEIAFGRLMGFLCVIFVTCWMPQLLTIPLNQMSPPKSQGSNKYHRIPDMLVMLHFVLDPYIYVLQRSSTFRRLFCSSKKHYSHDRPSVRMLSPTANTSYITKM